MAGYQFKLPSTCKSSLTGVILKMDCLIKESKVAKLFLMLFSLYCIITNGNKTAYDLPVGVPRISSDGDERRIFLGLKFSIPGFFWLGEFGEYFFLCVTRFK